MGVRHPDRIATKSQHRLSRVETTACPAELRGARLHDARHTAATVLLILGVPVRTVMSLMGWSTTETAARYQHVTDAIRQQVARQVDGLIWQARDEGDAGGIVTVRRDVLAAILPPCRGRAGTQGREDANGRA
ncbi:MAG: tyrosine-type recombinase/integrase [Actinomycetes bacterium]